MLRMSLFDLSLDYTSLLYKKHKMFDPQKAGGQPGMSDIQNHH